MSEGRSIAMLFPGHGAEVPRMGLALAAVHAEAARLLEHAGELVGVSVKPLLQRGGDRLADTRVLQPVMSAVLLGVVSALAERGIVADYALGHSLGELAAWSALGGPSASRTIELAAARGRALARVSETCEGAMLALPRLDADALAELLADADALVDVALHNAPGRWVLAGPRSSLVRIAERHGGSFVPTHGPWHSRMCRPARDEFEVALRSLAPIAPTPNLVIDADGRLLGERDPIPLLLAQIDGTVRFAEAMTTLAELAPTHVLLIGPAKPLRGLVRENWQDLGLLPDTAIHHAETPADLDALAEVLAP